MSSDGVAVNFPRGSNVITVTSVKLYGAPLYISTYKLGTTVYNMCNVCNLPYYSVVGVYPASIGNTGVKICKCPHSEKISAKLVSI